MNAGSVMFLFKHLEWPLHRLLPVAAESLVDIPDQEDTRVAEHPVFPRPVHQDPVVSQNDESLRPVPPQDVAELDGHHHAEAGDGVGQVGTGQSPAEIERPLQSLHRPLAGVDALGIQIRGIEERSQGLTLLPVARLLGILEGCEAQYWQQLRLKKHLPRWEDHRTDPLVEIDAINEAVYELLKVGAVVRQGLGQYVQTKQCGEEKPRCGIQHVVGRGTLSVLGEVGQGSRLELRRLVPVLGCRLRLLVSLVYGRKREKLVNQIGALHGMAYGDVDDACCLAVTQHLVLHGRLDVMEEHQMLGETGAATAPVDASAEVEEVEAASLGRALATALLLWLERDRSMLARPWSSFYRLGALHRSAYASVCTQRIHYATFGAIAAASWCYYRPTLVLTCLPLRQASPLQSRALPSRNDPSIRFLLEMLQ
ncbi:unnamed protein product [Clonostachys byssicola]|uniref:Uncharacterized protein n=1 Tax=Clonostachys byssicola TaxID=160290 RepID=A0A9N9Y0K0_9HYPO|nr:unnamed protein product [Clonostachys byssicola]